MVATANRSQFVGSYRSSPQRRCEPFKSAEEAWLWTMAALMARREGARYTANQGKVSRPCEPDDVVKCLDGLVPPAPDRSRACAHPAHLGGAASRSQPRLRR